SLPLNCPPPRTIFKRRGAAFDSRRTSGDVDPAQAAGVSRTTRAAAGRGEGKRLIMSIDRISRPAQPAAQPSAPRSPESASAFEVQRASCPEGEAAPAARTALERLRDGEIDRDAYVRAKVEAVLAPLH